MRAHAHEVLDAAFDAGVRYFDAARSYGLAEEFLGSWLSARGFGRDEVTVGSKWGYTYTAGWRIDAEVNEVKDLSIDTLRRQEAESRVLLGDMFALYQIHSATIESGVLEDAAVLRRARAAASRRPADRLHLDRPAPVRHDRAGGGDRPLRRCAGDVQPARPLRRPRVGGRPRAPGSG